MSAPRVKLKPIGTHLTAGEIAIRQKAWNALAYAVRAGNVTRPTCCGECGIACVPRAQWVSYNRPLEVTWWCRDCGSKRARAPVVRKTNTQKMAAAIEALAAKKKQKWLDSVVR